MNLTCYLAVDDVVLHKFGEKSSSSLNSVGFRDVTFKSYDRCANAIFSIENLFIQVIRCLLTLGRFYVLCSLGHFTVPEEMDLVCSWLSSKLGLDGSS